MLRIVNGDIIVPIEDDGTDCCDRERNVMSVRVLPKHAPGTPERIELVMSQDAMVGLAVFLLRRVYSNLPGSFWELRPLREDEIVERMGVHLHPDSSELLVSKAEFGTLTDLGFPLENAYLDDESSGDP